MFLQHTLHFLKTAREDNVLGFRELKIELCSNEANFSRPQKAVLAPTFPAMRHGT